jgi:hypothetical protein
MWKNKSGKLKCIRTRVYLPIKSPLSGISFFVDSVRFGLFLPLSPRGTGSGQEEWMQMWVCVPPRQHKTQSPALRRTICEAKDNSPHAVSSTTTRARKIMRTTKDISRRRTIASCGGARIAMLERRSLQRFLQNNVGRINCTCVIVSAPQTLESSLRLAIPTST